MADIAAITEIYAESVLNGVASYELESPTGAEMRARMDAISGGGFPISRLSMPAICWAMPMPVRSAPARPIAGLSRISVYIAPQARGRGVGKLLLQGLVDRCEASGFRQMVAVIGGASPASIALHGSCGFADAGRLVGTGFKHGRWLDTVFMQRPLGEGKSSDPTPLSL
nr:GNAT family N-acetyltransferase [Marinicella sp. W31]MDC2879926.1 GNAT family N-acetyltransferase [Marinicella sp. W31]